MTDPIRVLHFADVHIGMENYGKTDPETGVSSRVFDFLQRMDEMIAYADEHDVDLVIFAGDSFRSRSPNPTHLREFAQRIRLLSQLAPTMLLVGNHDLPVNAAKASTIGIFATLDVPNVTVAQDYTVKRIKTKRGDVIVGTAPYPIRSRLLQDFSARGMTIAEIDAELQRVLHSTLAVLSQDAEALADESIPRLLTGHFSVSGATWGSERSVMLGRDVIVDLEALTHSGWDYVALGHIHKHQDLTHDRPELPPVVYCGSLERIDFGEEGDIKGFCWLELMRGRAEWRFVPTNARKLLTMHIDCRQSSSPTRQVLDAIRQEQISDAVVRLVIQLTPEGETLLKDSAIVDELKRAGVFHIAGIRKEVERGKRLRLDVSPDGLTPLQLLERYFSGRDVSAARREELLELARGMMEGE